MSGPWAGRLRSNSKADIMEDEREQLEGSTLIESQNDAIGGSSEPEGEVETSSAETVVPVSSLSDAAAVSAPEVVTTTVGTSTLTPLQSVVSGDESVFAPSVLRAEESFFPPYGEPYTPFGSEAGASVWGSQGYPFYGSGLGELQSDSERKLSQVKREMEAAQKALEQLQLAREQAEDGLLEARRKQRESEAGLEGVSRTVRRGPMGPFCSQSHVGKGQSDTKPVRGLGVSGMDPGLQWRIEMQRLAMQERLEEKKLAQEEKRLALEKEKEEKKLAQEEKRLALEKEKADKDRAERAAQEEKRLALEKEKEEKRLALEKERLDREEEDRQERLALEKRRLAMEGKHGKEQLKLREQSLRTPKIEVPRWKEGDDPEMYLAQFENVAVTYGWDREIWADQLMPVVSGKLRDALIEIPLEQRRDWDLVSRTILSLYHRTPEWYRTRFRELKKDGNETFLVYAHRLEQAAVKWAKAAGVDLENPNQIWQLFMLEQFVNSLTDRYIREVIREGHTEVGSAAEAVQKLVEADAQAKMRVNSLAGKRDSRPQPSHSGPRSGQSAQGPGKLPEESNSLNSRGPPAQRQGQFGSHRQLGPGQGGPNPRTCHRCGQPGHIERQCKMQWRPGFGAMQCVSEATLAGEPESLCDACADKKVAVDVSVRVNGVETRALRDTGATCCVVRSDLVREEDMLGNEQVPLTLANGDVYHAPRAYIQLESPFLVGRVAAVVMDNLAYPVLIGNSAKSVQGEVIDVPVYANPRVLAVQTRGQAAKGVVDDGAPDVPKKLFSDLDCTPQEFAQKQASDPTLASAFRAAELGTRFESANGVAVFRKDKALVRVYTTHRGEVYSQLCVPAGFRRRVLDLAHDLPMSGHLGEKRTLQRVYTQFHWPGVKGDVAEHVRSCDSCQRTSPKGRTPRFPMQFMPTVGEPFDVVGVDLVGPLPVSSSGRQYILVLVDHATRYPEAVPLRSITAKAVAEALFQIFGRLGFPRQILTDQGTQFTGTLMKQVRDLLQIEGVRTTAYHPQTNGIVERFNGTLKAMLRRLASEKPRSWDALVAPALFAFREVPQESTGYSPFELMFGRRVRGPMAVLRGLWTDDQVQPEVREASTFVCELRSRIAETCRLARENVCEAAAKSKVYYDEKARSRDIQPGDSVLLLLPEKHNKLELAWQGPFLVEERLGACNFRLKLPHGTKVVHGNIIKKYHTRTELVAAVSVVEGENVDTPELGDEVPVFPLERTEGPSDVHLDASASAADREQLMELAARFPRVLSDLPGRSKLSPCAIRLTDEEPVRVKQYPLPHSQHEAVNSEIAEMLKLGVIEPSTSPYTAPVLIVKKKDGKNRFCIDYRALNRKVQFDSEPIPDVDHLFASVGKGKVLSKLDLTKGYWQVPVVASDRPKTAFATPTGLYQWTVVPFGLSTSGAVFSRAMRELLLPLGMPEISNFVDDILVVTDTWERHLECLEALLARLEAVGMTVKPSKCMFGFSRLAYLGYVVGDSTLRPEEEKVEKIRNAPRPETKRHLRSFLGMTGFYRRFCPNYSTVALPLTDATKKKCPSRLVWTPEMEAAFDQLRNFLTQAPLCVMPDSALPFVLRTDASDVGLGAVLLQDQGKGLQPIAYASKKLLPAERNYSVIERECLAIVWGIRKFEPYLFGREFSVQTDHSPLSHLDRMTPVNGRLLRWSLFLQQYRFDVRTIPGVSNCDADYLSRQGQESTPVRVTEVRQDLFTMPLEVSLAHCVSADLVMGCGVADQFRRRVGRVEELRAQGATVGQVAVLEEDKRFLYYLITKAKVSGKPAYSALRRALTAMFRHARGHGVKHIAMPLIGCGLDGLRWDRVRPILEETACDCVEQVTVCRWNER